MRRALALAASGLAAATLACATSAPQEASNRPAPPQSPVATQHPYEMKGKVQSVGGGLLGLGRSITIARDQAPAAVLHVADKTRVVLDGRVAQLSDLRAGDDVRAVFDFDQSNPVAIEIDAKPAR